MRIEPYLDVMKKIQKALKINSFQVAETPLRRAIDEHLVAAYCLARDGHLKNMNGGAGPGEGAFQDIEPLATR